MTDELVICKHCGKPIEAGEPWHTLAEMHWDCYDEKFNPQAAKSIFDRTLDDQRTVVTVRRKRNSRPGEGKLAKRLKKILLPLIEEAFKKDYGIDLELADEDMFFWVQPPSHRGPRWDLACWGGCITNDKIPGRRANIHSWETMTTLLANQPLILHREDALDWDVCKTEKKAS